MEKITDKCTLGNGMVIPCPGFGTYKVTGGDSVAVIRTAIEEGYRFFDTASLYETERFLGQAVRESGIPRSEFIIETKLWTDEMGYEGAKKGPGGFSGTAPDGLCRLVFYSLAPADRCG